MDLQKEQQMPPRPGLVFNRVSHRWIRPEAPLAGEKYSRTKSGKPIPPGWTDVWISDDPKAPVQAVGRDSKGRKVYLRHDDTEKESAIAKFSRLKAFSQALPSITEQIERDMDANEEAAVLYLIEKSGFRIGSENNTKAKVKAHGASNLRCEHIKIDDNKVSFDFIGKKGVHITKTIADEKLAKRLGSRCKTDSGALLFNTNDEKVREYLKSISDGKPFKVKDFRTWMGTSVAFDEIKKIDKPPANLKELNKIKRKVANEVAKVLGNTGAVALKSYIAPEIWSQFESNIEWSKDTHG